MIHAHKSYWSNKQFFQNITTLELTLNRELFSYRTSFLIKEVNIKQAKSRYSAAVTLIKTNETIFSRNRVDGENEPMTRKKSLKRQEYLEKN